MSFPDVPQVDLSSSWVAQAGNTISAGISDGANSLKISGSKAFASVKRKMGLPTGDNNPAAKAGSNKSAEFSQEGLQDWRVQISLPSAWANLGKEMLAPLINSNNALVFPYTPTIMLAYSAGYTPIKPVHSNYPFYSYQNSSVESLTIAGDFTVETEYEGMYYLSAQHFLRSVTKMVYGDGGDTLPQGAPPPICKLNGYGPHIFKDIPIVIAAFSMELPNDVDYMLIKKFGPDSQGTYVPTKSTLSLTCNIIHSREKIRKFSLQNFIQGDYVDTGEFR